MKRALLVVSALATASCFAFPPTILPISRILPHHGLVAPVYTAQKLRGYDLRPSALRMTLSSSQDATAALPAEAQQLKAELLQSCEKFKEAQLQMWQAEATKGGEKEQKDRLGGILGAESLGSKRLLTHEFAVYYLVLT